MLYYKYMPDREVKLPNSGDPTDTTTFIIRGTKVFSKGETEGADTEVGDYKDGEITFGSGKVVQVGGRIKKSRKSKRRKSKRRKSRKKKSKTRRRRR